jgi:hypothetical protein
MNAVTNYTPSGLETVTPEESPTTSLISRVHSVWTIKQEHVEKANNDKWHRYDPILIGGDLFTMGYLAFQGVTTYAPIPPEVMGTAILVCGVAAGVITILVAAVSLKESFQAFYNGKAHVHKGLRLLLDCIGLLGIGVVMVLTPLATKIAALHGLTTFFASYPWVLPLLFFVITIPLLIEIGAIIKNIVFKTDVAAELKLEDLSDLLSAKEVKWDVVFDLYKNKDVLPSEADEDQAVIDKMEALHAGMGVTASIETFKLFEHLLNQDKEQAMSQIQKVQNEISTWNKRQCVRLLQQVFFVIAFIVSMVALRVQISPTLLASIENFSMAVANAIPLYMDIFWPYERNTTLMVPKVEMKELTQASN